MVYLGVTIEEVFEIHAGWFEFQTGPPNHLITNVKAAGYCLEIILHTCAEVFLHPLVTGILGSTQVPLFDCDSLEAASKQVKLHGDETLLALVVLFPMRG